MNAGARCCAIALLVFAPAAAAQPPIVDPDFTAAVATASYGKRGPAVAIDEAHSNLHTASGRYRPLAELLANDGYRVVAWQRSFDREALSGVDVLVVANARTQPAPGARGLSRAVLTDREFDAVRDWVRAGGALLLVADQAPFADAAESLASRFGLTMGKGWVFDRVSGGGVTTAIDFSRSNGLLGEHAILQGRGPSERVNRLRTFAGQSLGAPRGAAILMKLSATAREAATREDLDSEDAASRQEAQIAGSYSAPAAGAAQAVALPFGRGRVVALADAALLSAEIVRDADGRETKIGMNAPGTDNRQLALNILHWLSRLLN
jgi:hypothetical protein